MVVIPSDKGYITIGASCRDKQAIIKWQDSIAIRFDSEPAKDIHLLKNRIRAAPRALNRNPDLILATGDIDIHRELVRSIKADQKTLARGAHLLGNADQFARRQGHHGLHPSLRIGCR